MIKNIFRNTLLVVSLVGGIFFILQQSTFALSPKIQEIKSKIKKEQTIANNLLESLRATDKNNFKGELSTIDTARATLKDDQSTEAEYQAVLDQYKNLVENENTKKEIVEYKRIPPVRSGGILPGPDRNYSGGDYIKKKFIPKFINSAITLLFSVSIVILIISGVMYIIASGDQDAIKKAKDMSLWAIAGTLLAIFSFTIVKFVIGINFGG